MQKALVTGGKGFLGKQIAEQLKGQSFDVTTLGRKGGVDINCDLANEIPDLDEHYQLVVHAAGRAHSEPQNSEQKAEFYKTNVEGARHLCAAFDRKNNWPKEFVFISSVSVYGVEAGTGITESQPLAGKTPYAKSKIQAEAFLTDWCSKHHILLSILRLPLIAGPEPPGSLGVMIRGIQSNRYFNIGEGKARKSMVMASDVGKWIPVISKTGGIYNLTDGYHPSIAELADVIAKQLNKKQVSNISNWLALPIAMAGNFLGQRAPLNCDKLNKITATLIFDDTRARKSFGWDPRPVLEDFIIY